MASFNIGFVLFPEPDPARLHRAVAGAAPLAGREGAHPRQDARSRAERLRPEPGADRDVCRQSAPRSRLRAGRLRRVGRDCRCGRPSTSCAARARRAKYVTSVCTGAFVLGVAGLLKGERATTHWAYTGLLPMVGATYEKARVVRDGNVFTGGGVTAGIDFALTVAAELAGAEIGAAHPALDRVRPGAARSHRAHPERAPAAIGARRDGGPVRSPACQLPRRAAAGHEGLRPLRSPPWWSWHWPAPAGAGRARIRPEIARSS